VVEGVLEPRPGTQSSLIAAAIMLALGFAICLALNWPGQLSYDSVAQLHDGRTGHYNAWHPPVMAWLLGLADAALPGTGLFILFDAMLLFGSMLSLLWLRPGTSWLAAAAAAACVALPQFVLYQGIVWKDVLFADSAVAGFLVLAHAGVRWRRAGVRWGLIGAAFLLFALAALARQNGAVGLAFGGPALAAIAVRNGTRPRDALVCGAGALMAAGFIVLAASLALAERSGGGSGPLGQFRLLQFYDLIGVVKADPALSLDTIARANSDLNKLIRSDGVRLYTPARNDTLYGAPELLDEFASTPSAAVGSQWWDVLLHHPFDYLGVRARVFSWVFLTPDPVGCDDWYAGVTGQPQMLRDLGLHRRYRAQDRVLGNYAGLFVGTPVFSHATYAFLDIVLLVFLFWRRRPPDFAIVSMLLGALAFAATFFVISLACDYRYLLFLDLAAVAGLFYCAATWDGGSMSTKSPSNNVTTQ
jgi:hypothetical protein